MGVGLDMCRKCLCTKRQTVLGPLSLPTTYQPTAKLSAVSRPKKNSFFVWAMLMSRVPTRAASPAATVHTVAVGADGFNPNPTVSLNKQRKAALSGPYQLAPGEAFSAEGSASTTASTPKSSPTLASPSLDSAGGFKGISLSGGAVVGIVIGITFVSLFTALLFYSLGRRKRRQTVRSEEASVQPIQRQERFGCYEEARQICPHMNSPYYTPWGSPISPLTSPYNQQPGGIDDTITRPAMSITSQEPSVMLPGPTLTRVRSWRDEVSRLLRLPRPWNSPVELPANGEMVEKGLMDGCTREPGAHSETRSTTRR